MEYENTEYRIWNKEYRKSTTCCLNNSSLVKLKQLQLNILQFALTVTSRRVLK